MHKYRMMDGTPLNHVTCVGLLRRIPSKKLESRSIGTKIIVFQRYEETSVSILLSCLFISNKWSIFP